LRATYVVVHPARCFVDIGIRDLMPPIMAAVPGRATGNSA
jgi:hypothetical protein